MTARLGQVLLALVHERFFRFDAYLEDVALICSDAELRLVRFFEELLRQVNNREIRRARRILSVPEQAQLSEVEERDAVKSVVSAAAHMDILLSETEVFPRQRPPLEVYDLVETAFPEVSVDNWELAIVLWPIYNFGVDPDLAERLKEKLDWVTERAPKHIVLYLAEIERANPIMWALLAHEMGHALDETKKIGDKVFGTMASAQIEEVPYWITEMVADSIAIKVLGPSYFFAFASLTLLDDNPRRYYESHPALHKRLEMLKQELELMGVLGEKTGEIVDQYYQLVMERVESEPVSPEDTAFNWEGIFNRIREVVDREIEEACKFDKDECKRSEALAVLLQNGITINSFVDEELRGSINKKARQLIQDWKQSTKSNRQQTLLDEFKTRLDEIINDYVEVPTHPVEILNAGWLYRWDEILDWCSASGSENGWWERLQKTDAILKKSIETISIHQGLRMVRNDPQ